MTFILSEDQTMLRDTALAFARDTLPVSHLRAQRDAGEAALTSQAQTQMADLGFLGVLIPENYGGSDFGLVGMGQIMEAMGRNLAATPLVQSGVIGAGLVALLGTEKQKTTYLPKIAEGTCLTALGLDEGAHHAPLAITAKAQQTEEGFVLNGAKKFVPDGHIADIFIILARTDGEASSSEGLSLFLVPKDIDGLEVTPLNTLDSHGAAHIQFDTLKIGPEHVLGPVGSIYPELETILDRARASLASEMLGAATAAFEMTLDYLKTRRQFGQLIGGFQALQHRAAVLFTELELTRSCVSAALRAVEIESQDKAKLVSLAKARAGETLHLVSNETVQMHGGIGMTDDHDSGFYLKRARVLEALYGGEGFHRDRYARLCGF